MFEILFLISAHPKSPFEMGTTKEKLKIKNL